MRRIVMACVLGFSALSVSPASAHDGDWRFRPFRPGPYVFRPATPPPAISSSQGLSLGGIGQVLSGLGGSASSGGYPPPQVVYVQPTPVIIAQPTPIVPQVVNLPPPPTYASGPPLADPVDIADIQRQLTERGYYAGPITGRMDDYTRTAISVYQSDVRLNVTGRADKATQNMLHFGPDVHATIAPIAPPAKEAKLSPPTVPLAPPPTQMVPAVPPPSVSAPPPAIQPAPPAPSASLPTSPPPAARPSLPAEEQTPQATGEPPKPRAAPQAPVEREALPKAKPAPKGRGPEVAT